MLMLITDRALFEIQYHFHVAKWTNFSIDVDYRKRANAAILQTCSIPALNRIYPSFWLILRNNLQKDANAKCGIAYQQIFN